MAKAAVENAKSSLRVSQQVRARVDWSARQGPVIPVLAVSRINGEYFVFLAVNEGKRTVARQKVVKIGEVVGNDYAVMDGVKAGDHLIVSGTQFLQDGAPVVEQFKDKNADAQVKPDANAKPDVDAK